MLIYLMYRRLVDTNDKIVCVVWIFVASFDKLEKRVRAILILSQIDLRKILGKLQRKVLGINIKSSKTTLLIGI